MPSSEPLLQVQGLCSRYGPVRALHEVDLDVRRGELVAIVGANGAGKTTLLHTLSGIRRCSGGSVRLEARELTRLAPHDIVRAGICQVPEGRQVFAPMTVRENLILGVYTQYRRDGMRAVEDEMEKVYDLFPVLRERAGQYAGTLSGGEQQMLAIGRSLMARPALIMMDEPSMGLAPLIVKNIFETVRKLRDEGNTVLLVEQNARAALRVADRGYVLETGKLVLEGKSDFLLGDKEVQRAYLGKGYKEIWE